MKTYEVYECNECGKETDAREVEVAEIWFTLNMKKVVRPYEFTNPLVMQNGEMRGDYCSIECLIARLKRNDIC